MEAEARASKQAEETAAVLLTERETAAAGLRAHGAELRAAREEAASAAAAAAAVAMARDSEMTNLSGGEFDESRGGAGGGEGGGGGGGADRRGGDGGGAAVREMRQSTARLQEGELLAVRKLLASSERKQQGLVEQLAAERLERSRGAAEASRLQALAVEYAALHERHEAALEMLGEQAEECQKLEDELGAMRGRRSGSLS